MSLADNLLQPWKDALKEKDKRILELENILCPDGHDFKPDPKAINGMDIDFSTNTKAKVFWHSCTRCRKIKRISINEEVY